VTHPSTAEHDALSDDTAGVAHRRYAGRLVETGEGEHEHAPWLRRAVVDVLVDGPGPSRTLSYLVPESLAVATGDAVHLPYGHEERHGLVLGASVTPTMATRDLISVFGQRVDPLDLALAERIAAQHLCPFWQIASRVSPSSNRNATPVDAGAPRLARPELERNEPLFPSDAPSRRMYLRSPLHDPARLAAREAARILAELTERDRDVAPAAQPQILILAPSVDLVERIVAEFSSGAIRLDAAAEAGAWPGFRHGTVPVGVGTRIAALYSAKRLAGIVVVEADHPGHDEQQLPYTNAATIAATRAAAHGIPYSAISASPTPVSLANGVKLVPLASPIDWPKVSVIDRTSVEPSARLVPPVLAARIRRAQESGREVVALCDRRPALRYCQVCKTPRPCERCSDHACEQHAPLTACTRCGDRRARVTGWDATRVQRLLHIDAYTLIELERLPRADRLVVLFDADRLLDALRLDPVTAFAQTATRLAGAAGERGELLVCTSQPGHELLGMLVERDQLALTKHAWDAAKTAGLPPFGHLVTIRVARTNAPSVHGWPGKVAGPSRRGDEWEILVRLGTGELPLLAEQIERLRNRGKLRFWVR
jgi:primosomal protein N'